MNQSTTVSPVPSIRAGAFDNPDDVALAIDELRGAGFQRSEIKVVCADPDISARFQEYIDERPSGAKTSSALSRAVVIYLVLAAIGLSVALYASLTTTLIATAALLGVALLVTFGSTMMTRGGEKELSDYYSQGMIPGQILLAIDLGEHAPRERLTVADRVFDRFTGSHAAIDHE